ncbi:uncharacterized protein LOC136089423 [Hydra vulgaris]|uniref:Uncharacterized protein LOC136089423 n=1 Tax=Hydra vulgaris TaxID=6087 RepID=A0ABM4DAV1_HYDVU
MLTKKENINLVEFNEILSKHFIQVLQISNAINLVKEKQSALPKNFLMNTKLKEIWSDIVLSYGLDEYLDGQHILYQFILTKVYEKLLIWRNNQLDNKNPVKEDLVLSSQEEKTLHYVAGFVAFSLAKRYKIQTNESAKIFLNLLESWRENSNKIMVFESIYDYTTWTERINRGGLFCVNKDFYALIYRIEQVVRETLNKSLLTKFQGTDLRDVIMPLLHNSKQIDSIWVTLICDIKLKELPDLLKDIIFKKWVNLRIKSFVDTWIQIAKKKKSISNRSEPSIRKMLNNKKNAK